MRIGWEIIAALVVVAAATVRCGAGLDTRHTGQYATGEADIYVAAPTGGVIGWYELSYRDGMLAYKGVVSTSPLSGPLSLLLSSTGESLIAGTLYNASGNLGYFARNTLNGNLAYRSAETAGPGVADSVALARSPARSDRIYVMAPSGTAYEVVAVDLNQSAETVTQMQSRGLPGPGGMPYALAIAPNAGYVFQTVGASFANAPIDANGDLSTPFATTGSGGYSTDLVFHPDGNYVYWNNNTTISVYYGAYDSATGVVSGATLLTGASNLTQTALAIDPHEELLAAAGTYTGSIGRIDVWRLSSSGVPTTISSAFNETMSTSPNLLTDLAFDASGRFLFATDCTAMKIWAFEVNRVAGDLVPLPGSPYDASALQCLGSIAVSESREAD